MAAAEFCFVCYVLCFPFTPLPLRLDVPESGPWVTVQIDGKEHTFIRLHPSTTGMQVRVYQESAPSLTSSALSSQRCQRLQGVISLRTIELMAETRKLGFKVAIISGARTSTMMQRMPFLPFADAIVTENGNRPKLFAWYLPLPQADPSNPLSSIGVCASAVLVFQVHGVHVVFALLDKAALSCAGRLPANKFLPAYHASRFLRSMQVGASSSSTNGCSTVIGRPGPLHCLATSPCPVRAMTLPCSGAQQLLHTLRTHLGETPTAMWRGHACKTGPRPRTARSAASQSCSCSPCPISLHPPSSLLCVLLTPSALSLSSSLSPPPPLRLPTVILALLLKRDSSGTCIGSSARTDGRWILFHTPQASGVPLCTFRLLLLPSLAMIPVPASSLHKTQGKGQGAKDDGRAGESPARALRSQNSGLLLQPRDGRRLPCYQREGA